MNAPTPDRFRRRFSLLRGPWHRSSHIVARIVLGFLVFCNLPGENVYLVEKGETVLQHGWPLAYVTRSYWQPTKEEIPANLFLIGSQVEDFNFTAVVFNVLSVLVASWFIGVAFEAWRRGRKHLWQFYLCDLMAAILVIGLMGAWVANQRQQYRQEQKTLSLIKPRETSTVSNWPTLGKSEGGITWLRRTAGDGPFQFLDRVVEIRVVREQLPYVSGLSQLAVVHVEGPISSRDLTRLADCRRLRSLDLSFAQVEAVVASGSTAAAEPTIDLPVIVALRGINLPTPACRWRGLAKLQNLESVDLASGVLAAIPEPQTMEDLAGLPQLRELSLAGTNLSGGRSEPLTRCSKLEYLNLALCVLDEDSFRHLGRVHNLRDLSLLDARFATGNLRHLASLSHLRELNLDRVPLPPSDYVHLSNLPVRELTLPGETINEEAITHLKRMKHLRRLFVTTPFASGEIGDSLRNHLTNCYIDLGWYQ